MIYPVFRDEENLFFSSNIAQAKDINSFSIAQYFGLLSDVETIVRAFDPDNPSSWAELRKTFKEKYKYELTCKAEFMSPGTIWGRLGISKKEWRKLLVFLICWGLLFGHVKILDVMEVQLGVFTPEARNAIIKLMIERMTERDAEGVRSELKLDVPQYNTKPLRKPTLPGEDPNSNIG